MTVPSIATLPTAPNRATDTPTEYVTAADAYVAALVTLATEINSTIAAWNSEVVGSTYLGLWSAQTGAKNVPVTVQHNGVLWALILNVADITLSEPTDANADWVRVGAYPFYDVVVGTLSGTTPAIDTSTGNHFTLTLSGATTPTFTNPPASGTARGFVLEVAQDAGASEYGITWPASVDWRSSGAAPTLSIGANDVDLFFFTTRDGGTTWLGALIGKDFI